MDASDNKQKMKVCYIHSASHSGSTVLNMVLASRFGAFGLGETSSVLSKKKVNMEGSAKRCSCDMDMTTCPFWGDVLQDDSTKSSVDELVEGYEGLVEKVRTLQGRLIVDSSKNATLLRSLKMLEDDGKIELRVIFLIRDVRGWVASMKAVAERDKDNTFLINQRRILNWYTINKDIMSDLEELRVSYLRVSYEQFVLDTNKVLNDISAFLELPLLKEPDTAKLHIAYSNRAKNDFDPTGQLTYDARWMHDISVQFWTLVFFPILVWNNKYLKTVWQK